MSTSSPVRRPRRGASALLGVVGALAAGAAIVLPAAATDAAPRSCGPGPLTRLGTLDRRVDEASGMVAGRRSSGRLWVHNDSGDGPNLYAITASGRLASTFVLDGARNEDWEDISYGPGGTIWVGDVGDNGERRPNATLYVVREPEVGSGGVHHVGGVRAYRIRYRNPVNRSSFRGVNVEAMIVDPRTGDVFLFDKRLRTVGGQRNRSWVYRVRAAALSTGGIAIAEPVTTIPGKVNSSTWWGPVAADVSADGSKVVIKNYVETFVWTRRGGEDLTSMFQRSAISCMYKPNGPGEALALDNSGSRAFTVSEGWGKPVYAQNVGG